MFEGKKIAVVVPAFNEEKLLPRTLSTIPEYVDMIVTIDDCSRDGTLDVARSFAEKEPERFVVLEHEVNQGVGGSIATGYKWCRDNDVDVAVVMAGDAQMDPSDLPGLLEPVVRDEVDYAKGNRLVSGEAWKVIPRTRYLGNAGLSFLTKIASGYWHVADSQTGYTAINKKALHSIDWDEMYKRFGQPNDLLVRLNIHDLRVCDVPVKPVYGIGEKSGFRPLLIVFKLAWLLIRLFVFRMTQKYIIRDFHPLVFFYLLSFILLFLCIPLSGRIVWGIATFGHVPKMTALALMSAGIGGLQSLFFAMWFDMYANSDLRRQK